MKIKLLLPVFALLTTLTVSAQPWAETKLEKSSRHGEWVMVTNGTRAVKCWVVYPEVKEKATSVLVIHEIFGLSDWARLAADEVAEAGYIAIAPDLLSGLGTNGGGTSELSAQQIGQSIRGLPQEQVKGDLNAAADYVKSLPAANGKLVVGGFCWGGGQTFQFATTRADLKAAFVFYGPPPSVASMGEIHCPVYGFYGEKDGRITLTSTDTQTQMKAAGKVYEPVIYTGAGHGFMRGGEDPTTTAATKEADQKARADAWVRWKDLMKKI